MIRLLMLISAILESAMVMLYRMMFGPLKAWMRTREEYLAILGELLPRSFLLWVLWSFMDDKTPDGC